MSGRQERAEHRGGRGVETGAGTRPPAVASPPSIGSAPSGPIPGHSTFRSRALAVWGVLNVTPDSFSDGGEHLATDAAVAHARQLFGEGADVVDIGGESSRPKGATYGEGFAEVSAEAELARVLPVVRTLAEDIVAGRFGRPVALSIDTVKGSVAAACVEAGCALVNDVSMGRDPALLEAVARSEAQYVLMHTRGRGEVVAAHTDYGADVVATVRAELEAAAERAVAAGVVGGRIWFDPGLGFAKTPAQSAALLGGTARLAASGHRVLVGASRKSFVGALGPNADGTVPPPRAREPGTHATTTFAALGGAQAVRVHDVAGAHQVAQLAAATLLHSVRSVRGEGRP